MTNLERAKGFWAWFSANNAQFLFHQEVQPEERDRMMKELDAQLKLYDNKLFFLLGSSDDHTLELVITADGDISKFEQVTDLVKYAPEINDWRFVAFKPALGVDISVSFEGKEVYANKLFFKPLRNPANPEALGLRIAFAQYDASKKEEQLELIYLLLDSVLGERSFATDIQYVDLVGLMDDPEEAGFIQLVRLAEFIEWKNQKGA